MVLRVDKFIFLSAVVLLFVLGLGIGIATGGIHLVNAVGKVTLPVIEYDRISDSDCYDGCVTVSQFHNDLEWLKEHGYSTVSVADLLRFAAGEADLPDKPVMLTFDGGYLSIYRFIYPLLRQYGFCGVLFPVISCIDYAESENNRSAEHSFMTWDEIKVMTDSGTMEIQNHTHLPHVESGEKTDLMKRKEESLLSFRERVGDVLAAAQRDITYHIGKTPVAIAYPEGEYGQEMKKIAHEIGFKLIFTNEKRLNYIEKADSVWMNGIGRIQRRASADSEGFFESVGMR